VALPLSLALCPLVATFPTVALAKAFDEGGELLHKVLLPSGHLEVIQISS
jgi:hypothetical protein